jgi:hypothetical protein
VKKIYTVNTKVSPYFLPILFSLEPLHDVNQQSLFCLNKELNKLTDLKWLALITLEFSIILSNYDFLGKEVFSLKESSII